MRSYSSDFRISDKFTCQGDGISPAVALEPTKQGARQNQIGPNPRNAGMNGSGNPVRIREKRRVHTYNSRDRWRAVARLDSPGILMRLGVQKM